MNVIFRIKDFSKGITYFVTVYCYIRGNLCSFGFFWNSFSLMSLLRYFCYRQKVYASSEYNFKLKLKKVSSLKVLKKQCHEKALVFKLGEILEDRDWDNRPDFNNEQCPELSEMLGI